MHRVFVGIKSSEALQSRVIVWQKAHASFGVRWIPAANLHLTVIPPWQEGNLEQAKTAFYRLSGLFGSFPLIFTEVALGPRENEPRLIWARAQAPAELLVLKKQAENIFCRNDKRPYAPHLTIARLRAGEGGRFRGLLPEENIWPETVSSLSLFESRLKPQGAQYAELARLDFA